MSRWLRSIDPASDPSYCFVFIEARSEPKELHPISPASSQRAIPLRKRAASWPSAPTAAMSFYLISEGLTCLTMFSGAYESLKVLSRAEKGVEVATLTPILEFWLVLGALTIFEEYFEFLVSWIPFYYLFKCTLLGLILMPNAKIAHVVYHGFIEPGVDHVQELVHTHVMPIAESLAVKHGHWIHAKLLSRSLSLLDDAELEQYEHDLQDKLQHVREEMRSRRRSVGSREAKEAK